MPFSSNEQSSFFAKTGSNISSVIPSTIINLRIGKSDFSFFIIFKTSFSFLHFTQDFRKYRLGGK